MKGKESPLESGYKGFFMEESLRKVQEETSPPSSPNALKGMRRRFPKGDRKALGKQHNRTEIVNPSKWKPSEAAPQTFQKEHRRSPEGDGQALWNKQKQPTSSEYSPFKNNRKNLSSEEGRCEKQ